MTQQADDKELMAAFAEFKELLQRETEPVGASKAPAVSLALETNVATRDGAALEAPRLLAVDAPVARAPAHNSAPPPIAPALSAADGWSAIPSDEAEAIASENETGGGRRKLIYLSVAVVAVGVASLGWTLTKWRPAEDPAVADLSLPAEPEAADQAALEPPAAVDPMKDALPAVEAATTNRAELTPPPAAEALAHEQAQPAEAPAPEAAAALPEAAAPRPAPAPRRVEAVSAPPAAAEAVAPVAAAAAAGAAALPLASTGAGGAARLTPPSAPRTASLPPANRFTPPEPVTPAAEPAQAAPKAPAPPKVAKPKPKPAPVVAKHAKPRPSPAESAPVASTAPVAAAPEPAPPLPAAPQNEGGPFGFVKRTFNSVGSTIGGVARSVIPQ
ncbi:hypothetical protein OGR47_02190 [Methylocystis sp. MJC1]|jgi:hypothetical protein|uniref:hypothetical protein n=1 Tax=Methylocystis sp. MJC1 TaxID=2654282 RepID=UPI0013EAC253|nr:hypothetical protein [Methylocystis sp. MJC1]KAF2990514.1 hypothetical protein MJC1_02276 [Methylocystis sp. MJC1]MBU6525823.1 hypothetical protein [Methylocystis sp. MJC1]UZX12290.1 hypothetical protein OGR47_02190 [Methylocystis sp. MJC1]